MMKKNLILLAFLITLTFNHTFVANAQTVDPKNAEQKLSYALQLLRFAYVDKIDAPKLTQNAIVEMLKDLDPHSIYISKEELDKMNEPLVGNFDGIGVQFQVLKDTIVVVDVISGGPSEKVGIIAGDKIVSIDGKPATGDSVNSNFVLSRLRGKKGTVVTVSVFRKNKGKVLDFTIVRDKIPLTSIDAIFMATPEVGYIRLDRFSRTSMDEFRKALADLKAKGMKHLMLDLRGNGGGFMDIAIELADEFLTEDKLIVYTEGTSSPKQDYKSTAKGGFEKGKLVLLIDEGSASASEIVSGAIQDWDRGLVVGRRSFGKGLVQRPFDLPDGSVIRLTTARYHTPSGRCIQRSYSEGTDEYHSDFIKRYNNGELSNADKIHLPDSLKYFTNNKRVVYGGGGIMPDVFIPMDTSKISDYYVDLRRKNLFNDFIMDYVDKNRDLLKKKYPDFKKFDTEFIVDNAFMADFNKAAEKAGIKKTSVNPEKMNAMIAKYYQKVKTDTTLFAKLNNYSDLVAYLAKDQDALNAEFAKFAATEDAGAAKAVENSDKYIRYQLKALLARNLYDMNSYYQVIKDIDDTYLKAVEIIQNDKMFDKLKGK
ncbi:MAG: S41 family peptidase [Bacteroidetes bacterium]|nr:S41 family peptidase [Bacteroidota bacterium]